MIDSVTFFSLAYEKIEATLQECIINMATQSACIRWPDVGNGSYCWPNVGVGYTA